LTILYFQQNILKIIFNCEKKCYYSLEGMVNKNHYQLNAILIEDFGTYKNYTNQNR